MRIYKCLAMASVALALGACGGGSDQPPPTIMLYKFWTAMADVPATGDFIGAMQQELAAQGIWAASTTCGMSVVPGGIGCPGPNTDKVGVLEVPEASVQAAAELGYRPLSGLRYYANRDCEALRLLVEPPDVT
jgi:hypothetical protein